MTRHDPNDAQDPAPGQAADALSSLMDIDADEPYPWRPDELAAILRHQMNAPVQVDLETLGNDAGAKLQTLAEARGLLLKSFGELLHHPNPPLQLLEMVKDFA